MASLNRRFRVEYNRLPELQRDFPNEVRELLRQRAVDTQKSMTQRVPVDTGRLLWSLRVYAEDRDPIRFRVVANTPYAGFVEFGTRFQAPNPYMRDTMKKEEPETLRQLSQLERRLR